MSCCRFSRHKDDSFLQSEYFISKVNDANCTEREASESVKIIPKKRKTKRLRTPKSAYISGVARTEKTK